MQSIVEPITPAETSVQAAATVQLLGGFLVSDAIGRIELPASTSRLLAFLAIQDRPSERSYTASCLWMDKPDDRAQANLRSCLWRLSQARTQVVCRSPTHLWLDPRVVVDLHEIRRVAETLMSGGRIDPEAFDPSLLCAELLPAWYDDFVEMEREQLRQIRLHALEQIADQFRLAQNWSRALGLALTAVACDPLRESAHRAVIAIHLDEGNVSEALRQYRSLVDILSTELSIAPSALASALVADWLSEPLVATGV